MIYSEGISNEGTLIDMGLTHNVVVRSGAWYSYEDSHIGQGRENSRQFLKENPEIAASIREKILAAVEAGDGKKTK